MKHSKFKDQELELQLQNASSEANGRVGVDENKVADLTFIMTNSAFGYEYAKSALQDEGEYGLNAEQIQTELENYKQAYFEAREQLGSIDSAMLKDLECELQMQKLVLFTKQEYLH